MEMQVKEFIETLKREGVDTARDEASRIVDAAQKDADRIVKEAQADEEKILSDARRKVTGYEQAAKDSLVQAGRDLLLNLENRIKAEFSAVIALSVKEAYSAKVLEDAIVSLLKGWASNPEGGLEVLLPEKDAKALSAALKSRLADLFKKGLEIKPSAELKQGFKVGEKGGVAHFDCSAEAIAEVLSTYLNPRLAEIIAAAAAKV